MFLEEEKYFHAWSFLLYIYSSVVICFVSNFECHFCHLYSIRGRDILEVFTQEYAAVSMKCQGSVFLHVSELQLAFWLLTVFKQRSCFYNVLCPKVRLWLTVSILGFLKLVPQISVKPFLFILYMKLWISTGVFYELQNVYRHFTQHFSLLIVFTVNVVFLY